MSRRRRRAALRPVSRYVQALREVGWSVSTGREIGEYLRPPGTPVVTLYADRFDRDHLVSSALYVITHEVLHHVHPDWDEDTVCEMTEELLRKRKWEAAALWVTALVFIAAVVDPHGIYQVD